MGGISWRALCSKCYKSDRRGNDGPSSKREQVHAGGIRSGVGVGGTVVVAVVVEPGGVPWAAVGGTSRHATHTSHVAHVAVCTTHTRQTAGGAYVGTRGRRGVAGLDRERGRSGVNQGAIGGVNHLDLVAIGNNKGHVGDSVGLEGSGDIFGDRKNSIEQGMVAVDNLQGHLRRIIGSIGPSDGVGRELDPVARSRGRVDGESCSRSGEAGKATE